MKIIPFGSTVADEDQHQMRTLWFADGNNLQARVIKVEDNGIRIAGTKASSETSEFIEASELCTVDRVHFGFGTRKEDAWVARVMAGEAKQKSARPALA